jgi:urease accessory protein
MIAVGIWGAQRGGRAVWILPATFVVTMAVGGIIGFSGIPLPGVEAGILASVLILGFLIAAAARFPLGAGMAVVALFAIFHGHAHGTEMPQTISGIAYSLGFSTATTLLHAGGAIMPIALRRIIGERQVQWVRLAGAGIGLAGLALLLV